MVAHVSEVAAPGAISVVLPTFNRAAMLVRTLPALLASRLVREVLVVNDGSSDDTRALVAAAAARDGRVVLLDQPRNLGVQAARNRGAASASGELVFFTEDDLVPEPGYFEELVRALDAHAAHLASGRRIWMRVGETEAAALARANRNRAPVNDMRWLEHNSHAQPDDVQEVVLLSGSVLVRREVLARVRYFEGFGGNAWREDSDFQLSAVEQGFRLVFCPRALAFHHPRTAAAFGANRAWGDLRYLYWIARNNRTFLARHEAFLRAHHPQALIAGRPDLTNVLYTARQAAWLFRVEAMRMWGARHATAFRWR